jgi:hypothetical protein
MTTFQHELLNDRSGRPSGVIITGGGPDNGQLVIPPTLKVEDRTLRVLGIGTRAFAGRDITEVDFPKGLSMIDKEAFADCKKLARRAWEGSEEKPSTCSIDPTAFVGCTNLDQNANPNPDVGATTPEDEITNDALIEGGQTGFDDFQIAPDDAQIPPDDGQIPPDDGRIRLDDGEIAQEEPERPPLHPMMQFWEWVKRIVLGILGYGV